MKRCSWCRDDPLLITYHDNEWGRFLEKNKLDDDILFELLSLEIMQAGLSWRTVLTKRGALRQAFSDFDLQKVAKYDQKEISKLLLNKDIIRHEKKITATVNNAERVLKIKEEFGCFFNYLDEYFNSTESLEHTVEQITSDMKNRGFKFIGKTTILSLLQTIGLANGHDNNCCLG